jgi:hypothetical protein
MSVVHRWKPVVVFLAIIIAVSQTSTGLAEDIPFSGFFGNQTVYEQLKPGGEGQLAKLRWLSKKFDPKNYNKFMVDSVIFFLADNSDYKGIDPQDMKELSDTFNKELVTAFKDKYPIVADPGPDVARIRIAITNIKPSRPGLSAITSIIPVGLGVSLLKKGATGGWSGSGQVCAEFMALDSMTNEFIILAIDQRKAEFEQRFTEWGSANDAFKFWSEKMVEFIDHSKGIKRKKD